MNVRLLLVLAGLLLVGGGRKRNSPSSSTPPTNSRKRSKTISSKTKQCDLEIKPGSVQDTTHGEIKFTVCENTNYRSWVEYDWILPTEPTSKDEEGIGANGKLICFIGVNPPDHKRTRKGTAAGTETTTKSWIGAVAREGGNSFRATNLFAGKATKPDKLKIDERLEEQKWEQNNDYILHESCDHYVPCWGLYSKVKKEHQPLFKKRALEILTKLKDARKSVFVFNINSDGSPKHAMLLRKTDNLKKVDDQLWKQLGTFAQHCANPLVPINPLRRSPRFDN